MDWPDPRLEGRLDDIAYIGLGSNLGDPREQVLAALSELGTLPGCTLVARSSLYATAPLGPIEQPDYINAVAARATRLSPLDLDLLVYSHRRLREPGLELPHPETHRRALVLVPLAEIAPEWLEVPGRGRLAGLLAACPQDARMRPIPEAPSKADKPGIPALSSPSA